MRIVTVLFVITNFTLAKFISLHCVSLHGFLSALDAHLPLLFRNPSVVIPESVLKKRKAVEKWAASRIAHQKSQVKKNRTQRQEIFKRAESYVKEYRQKEKDLIRMKREAKTAGNFFVADEAKVAFVIRIKG